MDRTNKRLEYATKIALSLIFLGLFAGFIWALVCLDIWDQAQFRFSDLILLGFATLRLGRLISYDLVMQPLRSPFTQTVANTSGSGDTVKPKGSGVRRAIGEMLSCPICSGTWAAAFLTYSLYLFPGPTRVFLVMTAAIGLVEILNALLEFMSWLGEYARAAAEAKGQTTAYSYQSEQHPEKIVNTTSSQIKE